MNAAQSRPLGCVLRGKRRGLTLNELLVAMALIVLIMAIVSEAFVEGTTTFRNLKAIGDMAERLRGSELVDLLAHFPDHPSPQQPSRQEGIETARRFFDDQPTIAALIASIDRSGDGRIDAMEIGALGANPLVEPVASEVAAALDPSYTIATHDLPDRIRDRVIVPCIFELVVEETAPPPRSIVLRYILERAEVALERGDLASYRKHMSGFRILIDRDRSRLGEANWRKLDTVERLLRK
jgi:prepilin-type N-terminal cleavage/methylation domain-containing protein